ncbi:protein dpy-30 homolog [Drosophila grimshawi]|uniref:GH15880 n=1 Tax=Drosophila grimshawi TaxID=7222 RepID=B4J0T4_DROGR|nr:protein dpy-30 homolog [Drosophila grimshawi]EDV95755.1 GH15880 [Drosophila grimshawi]
MSNKQPDSHRSKKIKCCSKDLKKVPKAVPKRTPPPKPVVCDPIVKPPEQAKIADKPKCNQPSYYRSEAQQRDYLQQEVVPILMEGMLGLAREQPRDPITYLEAYWLKDQHKCDIQLPKDLL